MSKKCNLCGNEMADAAKFCNNCGAELSVQPEVTYQQPQQTQQPQQQQIVYQAPQNATQNVQNDYEKPMSIKDWLLTIFLLSLPFAGFILLLVWAFGGTEKTSKSNYCKAVLIYGLIAVGLSILIMIVIFGIVGTAFTAFNNGSYYNYY